VTLGDGRVVVPDGIVDPPRRGRRVAVSGDTRPCQATVEAVRGVDLLIHEATFGDAEEARAVETTHSTAREAGRMAREAGIRRLVLTHLSSRYDTDPATLRDQAAAEFPGEVVVAHDGLVVELGYPE
jgi:ribonuclease Z